MSTIAVVTFAVMSILIATYAVFVVWVAIGAGFDLRALLRDLEHERVDVTDDGFVRNHQSGRGRESAQVKT